MWKILLLLLALSLPLETWARPLRPCGSQSLNQTNLQVEDFLTKLESPPPANLKAQIERRKASIKELQQILTLKLSELRSLRYDQKSSPEALPKLGLELQELRSKIYQEYSELSKDLTSMGVSLELPPKHCLKMHKP
ncbi:MAG: hypothetical protein IJU40_01620 [Desulfovibrionaceae bacterium]|nr:hypothetical protein [Desulfovibrionaceae bacterium]